MPQHSTKIILNPNADLGRAWRSAADLRPVVDEFGGTDWSGTVYPTHATELARQAALDGYELVIAAGGDGTVHEVINGLMQAPAERRPRLGVIPMGSGNDFAHSIGMTIDPPRALRQIFTGTPQRIDIGRLEDNLGRSEYWDNTIGIGFDATVTIRSRRIPYLRGFLIYLVSVLQTIILNHDAPRLSITSDLETWQEDILMLVLCNGGREGRRVSRLAAGAQSGWHLSLCRGAQGVTPDDAAPAPRSDERHPRSIQPGAHGPVPPHENRVRPSTADPRGRRNFFQLRCRCA